VLCGGLKSRLNPDSVGDSRSITLNYTGLTSDLQALNLEDICRIINFAVPELPLYMDLRVIIDCLVVLLFCVAAGINLWNIMIRDVRKKHALVEAVIGLLVLLVWVSSEAKILL